MPAGLHRFPTYKQATVAAILVLALLAGCGKETSPTEYLKLAQQAYDNGKPGEAILSLKQVLQQEPSNANARKLLAQLYIDDGNGTAAAVELDKAVAGGLSEQELVLQRLASLMLQGKYKEAIALTEQYRDDQQPASVRADIRAIRGTAQMNLGERQDADRSFAEAIKIDSGNGIALTGMSQRALADGRFDDALKLARKATEQAPHFAPGWSLLGDLLRVSKDAKGAEAAYTEAIAKRTLNANDLLSRAIVRLELEDVNGAGADIKTLRHRGFKNPHALFGEGLLALRENKANEAAQKFQEVLAKFPDYARAACYAGMSLATIGQQNQAVANLESCLKRYPQAASVRRMLAAAYSMTGQSSKVEPVLRPLVERTPPDRAATEVLAGMKLAANDPKAAAHLLQQIIADETKDPRSLYNLGLALAAAGDLAAASNAFAEAATLSPDELASDLAEANAMLQTGHVAQAQDKLEAILTDRPDEPRALNLLGIAKAQIGDLNAARELFEKTLAQKADDTEASLNLANTLTRQGQVKEALHHVERVLAHNPAHAQALGMAVALDVQAGELERARQRIASAEQARPDDPDIVLVKARFLQSQGERAQAETLLRDALAKRGDHPELLRELGQSLLASNKPAEASEVLTRLTARPERQPMDYLLLAQAEEGRDQIPAARIAIDRALELSPIYPAARLAAIRLDLREGKTAAARKRLDALKSTAPDEPIPELLTVEGQLLLLEKRPDKALVFFRRAFEARPSGEGAVQLARILAGTGKATEAVGVLETWVEQHPSDHGARFVLADSYAKLGQQSRAVSLYESMLKDAPEDILTLNNLAWVLRTDDPERALKLATEAKSIAPESPAVLDTFGVLLLDRGDIEEAIVALRKANALLPGNPGLRLHLATALERKGSNEEARRLLASIRPERLEPEQKEQYAKLRELLPF